MVQHYSQYYIHIPKKNACIIYQGLELSLIMETQLNFVMLATNITKMYGILPDIVITFLLCIYKFQLYFDTVPHSDSSFRTLSSGSWLTAYME